MYTCGAAIVVSLGCVLSTAGVARAQPTSRLVYGAILTEYYDRAYVAAPTPPARHVYFAGEPIDVRIAVGNRDDVAKPLDLGSRSFEQSLDVSVVTAPPGVGDVVLRRVGAGELLDGGRVRAAEWQGVVAVPAQGEVRVYATLATRGPMPPGVYDVRVVPRNAGPNLRLLSTGLCFEVRPLTTQAERAEVIRRRMESAETYRQDVLAERLADELLELYPPSASAYHVKALVAERRGRPEEATAALERALRLIRTKQDVLFVGHAGPGEVNGAEKGLEAALMAAGSARRP
jgi:hypothetical protein